MKTTQLKQHGIGRFDDGSPFPLGDLEVAIEGLPACGGEFRFLAYNNGERVAEVSLSAEHNLAAIPQDRLSAGRFSCFVSHYVKGVEVKRYPVEEILITDLNADLIADPAWAATERRIAALEQTVAELSHTVDVLRESLEAERGVREGLETRLSTLEYNNDILR